MGTYEIRISKQARKDIETLTPKLKKKLHDILIEVIAKTPYEGKKLMWDLAGSFSYRLNFKDRIIYNINETRKIVFIERAKTHYGE